MLRRPGRFGRTWLAGAAALGLALFATACAENYPQTTLLPKSDFTRLSFPPRWHYDILRGLDHFQAVDAARDERLTDAIEVLEAKRRKDGRWILENRYRGRTYFKLERIRAASRWNTLRGLRVLAWWGRGSA